MTDKKSKKNMVYTPQQHIPVGEAVKTDTMNAVCPRPRMCLQKQKQSASKSSKHSKKPSEQPRSLGAHPKCHSESG